MGGTEATKWDTSMVFLYGVTQRSGTNYLSDLLAMHPAVSRPTSVNEDGLLRPITNLVAYVDSVSATWSRWSDQTDHQSDLLQRFGAAAVDAIRDDVERPTATIVCKSPYVDGLEWFRLMFPDHRAVILVRDGRAVLESFERSWAANRSRTMYRWREGVRSIRSELGKDDEGRFLLVRYEDLYLDTEQTIGDVLDFLGLERADFDFAKACQAPVRGSSTLGASTVAGPIWEPVAAPADFAPLDRWKHWSSARRSEFDAFAHDELAWAGYEAGQSTAVGRARALRRTVEGSLLDWADGIRRKRRLRTTRR